MSFEHLAYVRVNAQEAQDSDTIYEYNLVAALHGWVGWASFRYPSHDWREAVSVYGVSFSLKLPLDPKVYPIYYSEKHSLYCVTIPARFLEPATEDDLRNFLLEHELTR